MTKHNSFLDRLARERDAEMAYVRRQTRIYNLDMVTIALGRMGFREARFKKFDDLLADAYKEYGQRILDDSKDDKELWYSKDKLDAEIKSYVGSLFVPFDERYK